MGVFIRASISEKRKHRFRIGHAAHRELAHSCTPEQAKKMASVSDGAIVGSAIVKIVAKYGKECIPEVEKYVKEMKAAVEI